MIRLTEAEHDRWPLRVHGAIVAVYALCMLLAVGYGFGSEDSANYIPLIWARLEPGLYGGDTAFGWILASSWNHHAAFFAETMAALGRVVGLENALFGVHALALFGLLWAWWLIGRAVGGPVAGYVTLLLLVTNRHIGGTMIGLVPQDMQPRAIGAALAFLAIAALVNGHRTRLAAALAGAATLMHPISALAALPVAALAPIMTDAPWTRRLREGAIALAWIAGPFLLWHAIQGGGVADTAMSGRVSTVWQQIIDFRLQGQAVNIAAWTPGHWLAVGLPLMFWFLALARRKPIAPADRTLGVAVMAAIALAGLGSVAADVFRSSMASQLMLSRLVYVPMVVGSAYGAWWLVGRWREGGLDARAWVLVAAAAWALAGPAIALLALIPLVLIDRARQDRWLELAARSLALTWLGVGVAVSAQDRWIPRAPEVAPPEWLIFADPPMINVLAVAAIAGLVLAASRWLGPARAPLLALAVATAPVSVYAATHRASGPAAAIADRIEALHAPWRARESDWARVAAWARSETPPGSRFLAPVQQRGFRALAKRPIVTDWKDGGLTLFSEAHAERWLSLYQELGGYERRAPAAIMALAKKHRCRYVIVPATVALPADRVYEAGRFAVYRTADTGESR